MKSFVKLNIGERIFFVNLQKIISIEMTEQFAVIRCENYLVYNIYFDQDMSKVEFMNAISNITNIYMIDEQNSSIG